jgi:hypothetical protein
MYAVQLSCGLNQFLILTLTCKNWIPVIIDQSTLSLKIRTRDSYHFDKSLTIPVNGRGSSTTILGSGSLSVCSSYHAAQHIAAENMLDLRSQHPILLLLPREPNAFQFYTRGLNTY